MGRIKTRESVKDIKILDKAAVVSERMKTALVRSKDQAENLMDDGQISPSEYAEDKIRYAAEDVTDQVWHEVSGQTKKAIEKGKEAHRERRNEKRIHKNEERVRRYEEEPRRGAPSRTPREEAARQAARQNTEATRTSIRSRRNQTIKSAERTERTIKQSARSAGKQTVKAGAKGTVKSTEKAVKTAEKTSKAAIKTAEATAKATQKAAAAAAKAAQKAAEIARQTAIAAYKAAVAAAKAVAAAIKAIAAAMKALVAAIAAGGWVAVVVVVVICLVALIACSCFGIFFSSEDTGSEKTMRQVVQEINLDYQNELDAIKDSVVYDALEMSGSRAVWPEVLSVYAVKTTSDPDNPQEVATITPEKEQLLKDLFWEMNEITHRTETKTETVIIETDDGNGNILEEEVQETITTLYITVLLSATRRRMRWLGSTASMRIKSSNLQNCLRRIAACGRRCFTESTEWMTKSLPWRCRRWAMWAESPIGHGTASAAVWSGAPVSSAGVLISAAISTPVSFLSSQVVSTASNGSGSVGSGRITPWSPRPA